MNQNTNNIFKLLITLLTVSLVLLMSSCGTRKVEKSHTEQSSITEQATTEKKDITTDKETKTVINDESNELEITPIDTSKVLIINGKEYKNAKIKIIHRKTATNVTAKETVKDLSKKDTRVNISSKKATRVKNVERKSNPFGPLFWILLPAAVYFIWKNKHKFIGLW